MDEKPLAEKYRVAFIAEQMLQYQNPEEWVARRAHTVGASSFDQVCYPDPAMDAWVARTHQLLASRDEVARCRRAYLTSEERTQIDALEADLNCW